MSDEPQAVGDVAAKVWEFHAGDAPQIRREDPDPLPTPDELAYAEDQARAQYAKAVQHRKDFAAAVRGALARAELLPREHLPTLGFAAADLMIVGILTGRYKPRSAKEAAEIAKIMLELARRETGEPDKTIRISSPDDRKRAMDALKELAAAARARALESGAPPPDDSEVIDVTPARTEADSIPSSTPGVRVGILR